MEENESETLNEVTLDPHFFANLKTRYGEGVKFSSFDGNYWIDVDQEPWKNAKSQTVSNDVSELNGFSVREERPIGTENWPKPKYCYFVHMRVNRERPEFYVRHFLEKIPEGMEIGEFEQNMLYKARSWWGNGMEPVIYEFDDFDFGTDPCYVSFVLDEETWKFHPFPADDVEETVVFRKSKLVSFNDEGKKGARLELFEPNVSFFNFQRFELKGYEYKDSPRQGFRFINFMKGDKEGSPLNGRKQRVCLDIYIKMPYARRKGKEIEYLTLVYDPPPPSPGPPPPSTQGG